LLLEGWSKRKRLLLGYHDTNGYTGTQIHRHTHGHLHTLHARTHAHTHTRACAYAHHRLANERAQAHNTHSPCAQAVEQAGLLDGDEASAVRRMRDRVHSVSAASITSTNGMSSSPSSDADQAPGAAGLGAVRTWV